MLVSNSKVIKGNKIGDTDTFFFLRVHDREIFFSDPKKGKKMFAGRVSNAVH